MNEINDHLRLYTKHEVGIQEGCEFKTSLGTHKLTAHESDLLYTMASNVREEFFKILEDRNIDLKDLE